MNSTTMESAPQERAEAEGKTFNGSEWLSYLPGSVWILAGCEVVIDRVSGVDRLIVRKLASDECVEVERAALAAPPTRHSAPASALQIEAASNAEIEQAKAKEAAFSPYLDGAPLSRAERLQLAATFHVGVSTLKRWLKNYRATRHWSVFIPKQRGAQSGVPRLDAAVDAIITGAIEAQAEVDQDFTSETIIATIRQRCRAARLDVPSLKTVSKRVNAHRNDLHNLPADIRAETKRQTRMKRGSIETSMALEVVQVDHTPADEGVNCPVTGRPLGCPNITIVFDVHTRVVMGFCLTLEAPSQLSTALALHHAVFPKDAWLKRIGAMGPWPFYGIMKVLHTDRAAEFVSPHFVRAATRWNIETQLRQGGQPQHGGHIERYLGTLLRRIHGQKGASRFRGKKRRNAPKGHHTLASLLTWIANEISAYHHERHRGIGMSPAQAWEKAWTFEDGLRLPIVPRDEREFLISFLPGASRVVSREGILWKGLQYRCPELEPFIAPFKRQFFRFDKRDISTIYFDAGEGSFLEVPWTQVNYPELSYWEWEELRPALRNPPRETDAQIVHTAREANRELNLRLQSTSQRSRRRLAREIEWQAALPPPDPNQSAPLSASLTSSNSALSFEVLE